MSASSITTMPRGLKDTTLPDIQSDSPQQSEEEQGHQASVGSSKLGLRQRIKHFTFAWFLSTMSTGSLAIAIGDCPHQFRGQYYIGLSIFFFNLVLFLLIITLSILRFAQHKQHVLRGFTHPAESFFLGAFTLSTSVVIGGIQTFGVTHGPATPWILTLVHVLYWIYAAVSLLNAIAQYWILICCSSVRPIPFSPSIFLAGYSAMLMGMLASLIVKTQPEGRRVPIVVAGVAYQGFGWCVSFVALVLYMRSLLDNGLPAIRARAAMFIPVGSCAYTVVALMGMARGIASSSSSIGSASASLGENGRNYFSRHPDAPEILRVMALFASIFLYAFAFWLFAIAILGNAIVIGKMPFSLSWWAFIFPNVGFTLATSILGKELESDAILWVASVMTALLVAVWTVAAVGCVRAVWKENIIWPGRDEDKDR